MPEPYPTTAPATMADPSPGELAGPDGTRLAYVKTAGRAPGVMFLGGFMSDMTGTKASALERFCHARGQAFVRFDYRGHGASGGRFEEGTIGRWTEDALAVIDAVAEGPQILVGSSMGGWIMLLAALARPGRVCGLLGVAPAPDFTARMVAEELTAAQRAELARDGATRISSDYDEQPYVITRALIDDGARHLLLDRPIALGCPVRLVHGMKDEAVPWATSIRIMEALTGDDVAVTLVKDGDHRLSGPADIARLCDLLAAMLDVAAAQPAATIAASPSR